MTAGRLLRRARDRAGLSLRELAARAGTSHSTLSAYETGAKVPSVTTLERILRAAGFALDLELVPRTDRGQELERVLELAGHFPARHAPDLRYPPFPRERSPGAR
ncbi:MAG TPA: helix-turn-helix transcriptional regulator [Acidimicrobiales bacterium]|nr:helix-turn-helix transcriptional regulator [Acidimicrobiales bacterium]